MAPVFQLYATRAAGGAIPYRDFSLEYPPGALPPILGPELGPWSYVHGFQLFEAACGSVVVVCVAAVLAALGATRLRLATGVALAAVGPYALGPIALGRFDLWPTVFTVLAIAALLRARARAAGVWIGLGAAAKVFPVALLPVAVLTAASRSRREAKAVAAAFAVAVALVLLPFAAAAPGGVASAFREQSSRGLQLESVAASGLLAAHSAGSYAARVGFDSGAFELDGALPDALAWAQSGAQLALLAAVWVLYGRGPRGREQLVAAAAAALAVSAVFGRVLSPQFLVWFVPAVALLRTRAAVAGAMLLVPALLLSRLVYPARYDALVALEPGAVWLLVARNALLVALVALLVAQIGIASRRR